MSDSFFDVGAGILLLHTGPLLACYTGSLNLTVLPNCWRRNALVIAS